MLDESQQSAPSRRLWASGLRDQRDFILGRKCAAQLLINCARRSRGRTARNRFLFGTDPSFLSHQKIPTILERRPPWPLLRPLRRIWENGYHSLAWHPRAKLLQVPRVHGHSQRICQREVRAQRWGLSPAPESRASRAAVRGAGKGTWEKGQCGPQGVSYPLS